MDKKLFRREMKQRNRALSAEERRAASECIFSQVERLPAFAKAHCIAFFSALDDEPATDHFLERWHQSHRIVLPKVDGDEMDFFEYDPSTIEQGAFGIMEPSERSIKVSPSEIDLMIVPGVGFTLRGARMGRGRGYYDKYLSRADFRALKVGVCFRHQVVEDLAVEPHDVFMDVVCHS